MARAAINAVTQIGVETVIGTAVPCNRRFPDLQWDVSPNLDAKFYRPEGTKFEEAGVLNREWAVGDFNGPLSYDSLSYLLASYVAYIAPVTTGSGYTWTHNPAATGADIVKSYTIQRGDSTAAGQATGTHVTSLSISIDRMNATVKGNSVSKRLDYASALTAAPTTIANTPVSMNDVDVYLDAAFATVGTTKLTDVFDVDISLPDKYDEKWVLDSTQTSWKDIVEKAMAPKVTLRTEWSTQMQAVYTAMKADALPTRYLQVKVTGETLSVGVTQSIINNYALKLEDAKEDKKGDGGVYAFSFTFRVVHDATMGRPFSFVVVNSTSGL